MRWSSPSWWQESLRVDLAEIMDDLDPGWRAWRGGERQLPEAV